ncbi:hypothetical protein T484DRAFT_1757179, partial [Baffinella frigidus]
MEVRCKAAHCNMEIGQIYLKFARILNVLRTLYDDKKAPTPTQTNKLLDENLVSCQQLLQFFVQIKGHPETMELVYAGGTPLIVPQTFTPRIALHGTHEEMFKVMRHAEMKRWLELVGNFLSKDETDKVEVKMMSFNFLEKCGAKAVTPKKNKKEAETQLSRNMPPNHPMKALEKKAEETAKRDKKKTKKTIRLVPAKETEKETAKKTPEAPKAIRPVPAKETDGNGGSAKKKTAERAEKKKSRVKPAERDEIDDGYRE